MAVVVPSPAASFVLLATSWTSFAPMFWYLSSRSTALTKKLREAKIILDFNFKKVQQVIAFNR